MNWTWHELSASRDFDRGFWIGKDAHGVRWLVKFRGGFYAVRERAFSIVAQSLGISCQSSTFLKFPRNGKPLLAAASTDVHQLAILFLEEHEALPCDNCPLQDLRRERKRRPYDVEVLRASPVPNAIDIARGAMLGMLCEMDEPPGYLFTRQHRFVQIDNKLMFSHGAGVGLWDSPWVIERGDIRPAGLKEAVRLCEEVLVLPEEVFVEAAQLPQGYRPRMDWSVRREINKIRPRARSFLEGAVGRGT